METQVDTKKRIDSIALTEHLIQVKLEQVEKLRELRLGLIQELTKEIMPKTQSNTWKFIIAWDKADKNGHPTFLSDGIRNDTTTGKLCVERFALHLSNCPTERKSYEIHGEGIQKRVIKILKERGMLK